MGFGKPNDEHNPPVPLHGHGEFAFSCRESGVAECGQISLGLDSSNSDFLSFPYMSNSPWDNIHASHQSYPHDPQTGNHLMAGLMRPDTLQSLQVDPSLSNLRGNVHGLLKASEMSYLKGRFEKYWRSIN